MKTYNRPSTQITECKSLYMLMSGNVSGGGFKGAKTDIDGEYIDIF